MWANLSQLVLLEAYYFTYSHPSVFFSFIDSDSSTHFDFRKLGFGAPSLSIIDVQGCLDMKVLVCIVEAGYGVVAYKLGFRVSLTSRAAER